MPMQISQVVWVAFLNKSKLTFAMNVTVYSLVTHADLSRKSACVSRPFKQSGLSLKITVLDVLQPEPEFLNF
jgi:hypothetical protein